MSARNLLSSLVGALLVAASPGTARAMGIGVEIGGTDVHTNNASDQSSFALGLIIDNTFSVTLVDFTLWADVQTPFKVPVVNVSSDMSPGYLPVDLGLRVGLALPVEPYVGLLIGGMFQTDSPSTVHVPSAIFTVGGDLGADLVFGPLRFGLELRGMTLTGTDVFPDTWVWQLLASARFSF